MSKVSIITACYNSALYLNDTIESVLSQTYTNWEWLITDDQSTDNSLNIINSIVDDRVKIFKTNTNSGAGESRNVSLKHATGKYITFLDSDDIWHADFLDKMINFMQKNNADLAYSGYERCNENLEKVLKDFSADSKVNFNNLLKTCRLSLLSSMYNSEKVGKIYFPKGTKREDHVMWLELLKIIPEGLALNETLAKYRMREGSVSFSKKKIIIEQFLVYRKFMNFSIIKSLYYTSQWAINGYKKYSN